MCNESVPTSENTANLILKRYHGMHEWLVWAKMPQVGDIPHGCCSRTNTWSQVAIMHTFTVKQLLSLSQNSPAINAFLRLDMISEHRKGYAKTILPALKAHNVSLRPNVIKTIAQVLRNMLGLDGATRCEFISHVVADIIGGWGLVVAPASLQEWQASASLFAAAMFEGSTTFPNLKDIQQIKLGWLEGVAFSTGDDGYRQNKKKSSVMISRMKRIGLASPSLILADELNTAKLAMSAYEKVQRQRLRGSTRQALLLDAPADTDDDDENEGTGSDVRHTEEEEDEIRYEIEELELR